MIAQIAAAADVSVGTIFTIFRNPPEVEGVEKSVLQPGAKQVAAGYVLYGSSTVLVFTCGNGVHQFTLDPQFGAFLMTRENIKMPEHAGTYSVNSNAAFFRESGFFTTASKPAALAFTLPSS